MARPWRRMNGHAGEMVLRTAKRTACATPASRLLYALRCAVCAENMMPKTDSADSVLEKMTAGRFRHMPVVEAGDMVGLITIGDVVKARLSELAMEKDALEGMIMGH